MSAVININGVALAPIEFRGARVMTLSMMDSVHKRADGTARRNFNENKARLIEGEDYFVRNSSEARELGYVAPNGLALLTETGYSMLVKSFTDDLAWDVQRQLVKSYFNPAAKSAIPNFADEIEAGEAWLAAKKEARAQAARAEIEAEKVLQLEHQVAELAPAAEALERIASDSEHFCMTDAAKQLQIPPRKFTKMLLNKGWIYVRESKKVYVAAQPQLDAGYLTHRYGNYQDPDTGQWKKSAQVLVTGKGITKLSMMLSIRQPQQQASLQI